MCVCVCVCVHTWTHKLWVPTSVIYLCAGGCRAAAWHMAAEPDRVVEQDRVVESDKAVL